MRLLPFKEQREYLIKYGRDCGLRLTVTRMDSHQPWVGFLWVNHRKKRHRIYGPAILSFMNGKCIRRYYALDGAIYADLRRFGIEPLDRYPWFKDNIDEMAWLNEAGRRDHVSR